MSAGGGEGESEARTGPVVDALRAPLLAVAFLTRIPCPRWVGADARQLARSTAYFPAVGVVVGLVGATAYVVAAAMWTPLMAAILSTAATVRLTGAFHEDALADSCDGLGGGWERTQVLTIMKDSRIGSYGTVGLALTLLAKVAALATLGDAGVAMAARALVVGHVLGRWSSLPLMWALPYVSEAGAKSRAFESSVTGLRLAAGTATAIVVTATALAPLGVTAVVATLAGAALVELVGGRYFRRRLGGVTGDCLGAANQLVELTTYLILASAWLLP